MSAGRLRLSDHLRGLEPVSDEAHAVINGVRLVIRTALRDWWRNKRVNLPALASAALLILVFYTALLAGITGQRLLAVQDSEARVVRFYLREDVTPEVRDQVLKRIQSDPRVAAVRVVSKAEALQRAKQRPGLSDLIGSDDANPFPASLDVQARRLQDTAGINATYESEAAFGPVIKSSYDRGATERVRNWLTVLGAGGLAFLVILGFVCVAVTANSARSATVSRQPEIDIMRLVGASPVLVSAPFALEGFITGCLGGIVGGGAVVSLVIGFQQFLTGRGVGVSGAFGSGEALALWPVALVTGGLLCAVAAYSATRDQLAYRISA